MLHTQLAGPISCPAEVRSSLVTLGTYVPRLEFGSGRPAGLGRDGSKPVRGRATRAASLAFLRAARRHAERSRASDWLGFSTTAYPTLGGRAALRPGFRMPACLSDVTTERGLMIPRRRGR